MKKPKPNAKPRNTLAKEIRKAVRGGSNCTYKNGNHLGGSNQNEATQTTQHADKRD